MSSNEKNACRPETGQKFYAIIALEPKLEIFEMNAGIQSLL